MDELISVIVPVYKVEKYINRCVNSILEQTYKNIEIILVDDGSPDKCPKICDEYLLIDKRIKVIHKKNGGLSEARNVGLKLATGKYLTFIDSDDWIKKDFIERLYILLKRSDADISICNYAKVYDGRDCILDHQNYDFELSNIKALEYMMGELYSQMVVAWGKLYRNHLFDEVIFPVGKIHEDEFTTYKLLYASKKVIYTSQQLLFYWQRDDSIMGNGFKLINQMHVVEALNLRIQFFEEKKLKDLVNKTYKQLFAVYKLIRKNTEKNDRKLCQYSCYDFELFKTNLRKSTQSFRFKCYYEIYFFSPKLADFLEGINSYVKKRRQCK